MFLPLERRRARHENSGGKLSISSRGADRGHRRNLSSTDELVLFDYTDPIYNPSSEEDVREGVTDMKSSDMLPQSDKKESNYNNVYQEISEFLHNNHYNDGSSLVSTSRAKKHDEIVTYLKTRIDGMQDFVSHGYTKNKTNITMNLPNIQLLTTSQPLPRLPPSEVLNDICTVKNHGTNTEPMELGQYDVMSWCKTHNLTENLGLLNKSLNTGDAKQTMNNLHYFINNLDFLTETGSLSRIIDNSTLLNLHKFVTYLANFLDSSVKSSAPSLNDLISTTPTEKSNTYTEKAKPVEKANKPIEKVNDLDDKATVKTPEVPYATIADNTILFDIKQTPKVKNTPETNNLVESSATNEVKDAPETKNIEIKQILDKVNMPELKKVLEESHEVKAALENAKKCKK
jgi:hypothetical protein